MRDVTGRDLAAMVLFGFVVPLAVGVAGMLAQLVTGRAFLAMLGVTCAMIIVGFVFRRFRRRGWTWRDFGFTSLGLRGFHLLWQIPATMVISLLIAAAVGGALGLGDTPEEQPDGMELFIPPDNVLLGFLVVSFFAVIAGPVWEEIVFRRFIMGWLDTRWNTTAVSVLVSAGLFAAVHLVPVIMVWTFLLGIWCALLVRWHKSLWASVIYHMLNNLLVSVGMAVTLFAHAAP